jgi:hypothetical protein
MWGSVGEEARSKGPPVPTAARMHLRCNAQSRVATCLVANAPRRSMRRVVPACAGGRGALRAVPVRHDVRVELRRAARAGVGGERGEAEDRVEHLAQKE